MSCREQRRRPAHAADAPLDMLHIIEHALARGRIRFQGRVFRGKPGKGAGAGDAPRT